MVHNILDFVLLSVVINIKNQTQKMKQWELYEDQLLISLYHSITKQHRWKKISNQLEKRNIIKTPYACRQRYLNKLDPKIKFQQWNQVEISQLFEYYQQIGSHWNILQKMLPGRTQSSIKNKFYSTLRSLMRAIYSDKSKNILKVINRLNTKTLTQIYQGKRKFRKFKGFVSKSLEIMNYDINSQQVKMLPIEQQQKSHELLKQILAGTQPNINLDEKQQFEANNHRSLSINQQILILQNEHPNYKDEQDCQNNYHKKLSQKSNFHPVIIVNQQNQSKDKQHEFSEVEKPEIINKQRQNSCSTSYFVEFINQYNEFSIFGKYFSKQ